MVKILIENINSKIIGHLPDNVQKEISESLSYKVANARHMPIVKSKKWDGIIRLYGRHKGQVFYTGLLSFVRDILKKNNISFTLEDRRIKPPQNLPDLKFDPPPEWNYEERDYQTFTIERGLKFTRGVLGVCTGGGKTVIVTRMISEIKTAPFIFYVLTKDLMYQAHDTMTSCLNEPIGLIGDGKCDIKNINVMTIQTAIRALNKEKEINIKDYQFDEEDIWEDEDIDAQTSEKIKKLIRSAKGIYFDETHHAAANTCKEVLESSPNAYWRFGGSATPYRETGDEIMIQAMFGGKIVDISASYLIQRGYLIKPYIFMVPVDSKVDLHTYQKIYKHCISENNQLNDHVAELSEFLNSVGLSNLVLVQHYPQGNYVKKKIENKDVKFVTGKMTTKQRKESINDLRNRVTACMIATSLADEGLDIPVLDSVTMAGGGASSTRVNQRIGRTLRKSNSYEKKRSIVIIYEHNARFLERHAKKVRRILKKEPEFEVINSKGIDFLFDEIREILGLPKENKSIFDV